MGEYRTIKGYDSFAKRKLTRSMEDYLEMICRLSREEGFARVAQLSARLNVRASSASKMAEQLRDAGYLEYEKYGYLRPTEMGWKEGEYLLHRHEVLHDFLCMVNGSTDELEQVEQIEHFFNRKTIENLERMLNQCHECRRE